MDWGIFFRAFAAVSLALAAPGFYFLAPSVPGWADTVATASVYSYIAGGLSVAAIGALLLNRPSTRVAGIFLSLPVLLFSALSLGIIVEYDVDTATRYIRGDTGDVANWVFITVATALVVVATGTILHWGEPGSSAVDQSPRVSAVLLIAQFGICLAAAIEGTTGKLDMVAVGLAAGAAITGGLSLLLFVWMLAELDRRGWAIRSVFVVVESIQGLLVGIGAGYLYQLGNASAGTNAETVGWIFVAALATKALQWSIFHWDLPL